MNIRNLYRKETILTIMIMTILLLGAFLRFYRIRDYLIFLGDEGRDVLVAKRILIDHKFTLLGPITSVGGMYLGPIYYYFMTPFLWLFGYDPVGPSIMVALFGVATIYLIYLTGTEFFSRETGIIASLLYSTSPLIITYSHSSWNPNILPFFSLLIIYSLLKSIMSGSWKWIFFAGFAFGISLQLHYLSLFFLGVFGVIFFLYRQDITLRRIALFMTGIFSTLWPFLLFELRHGFPNVQTMARFIAKRNGQDVTFALTDITNRLQDVVLRIIVRVLGVEQRTLAVVLFFAMFAFFVGVIFRRRNSASKKHRSLTFLLIWFGISVISYSVYQGAVYDYYFVPIFALPFLLIGIFLSAIWKHKFIGKILVFGIVVLILTFHIKYSPLRKEPNRLLDQSERIAQFVYSRTGNKPYNFALISAGNSEHAYRFFLDLWSRKPVRIENTEVDPERSSVTDQLLVVCEDKKNCQPLGYSLWEIAGFGKAEIDGVWDIFPVRVVRMVPYEKS